MSLLIEDSPRNLLAWINEAIDGHLASGAVITPFATPWPTLAHRRSARAMAAALNSAGSRVWFDPTTHALQMAGVGDFRYYDGYSLWAGPRGDLSTVAFREEHVRRVFEVQDQLRVPHLAPTLLLHHAESATSQEALDMAAYAAEHDPECWLSVAGTPPFWAGRSALDAHVGALAQLRPAGWFMTVSRSIATLPVEANPEEVHGMCRTTRALSEMASVHISHGDVAALAAVAAGASSVGTGWDQRQRVSAFSNFTARPIGTEGGGWYERPSFRGLFGSLKVGEAAVLASRDVARARRLGGVPAPGPREAFLHHLDMLGGLVSALLQEPDLQHRYQTLSEAYAAAAAQWPPVTDITASVLDERDWIEPFAEGLRLYGASEGW